MLVVVHGIPTPSAYHFNRGLPNMFATQKRNQSLVDALHRSSAVIEFDINGLVVDANANFLKVTGYDIGEIRGQHHRVFCDPTVAASEQYARFWQSLARGEFVTGEFQRFGKDGREIWIQASYNPVFDSRGNVIGVVKFATDITEAKRKAAEFESKVKAIHRSQAVIEFDLEGNILDANENFLAAVGYSLDQIVGKHHRIFCDADHVRSPEYTRFWERLADGEFCGGRFERRNRDGDSVWIEAGRLRHAGQPAKLGEASLGDVVRGATE